MNVFFDNQTFYEQNYGGISRYFVELIKSLNAQNLCSAKVIAPYHRNEYLYELQRTHPEYFDRLPFDFMFDNRFWKRPDFYRRNYTRLKFNFFAKSILHETYYYHRIDVKAKTVITIHDMIFERYNNGSEFHKDTIQKKREAIMRANAIICVSHNTKKDLLEFYPQVADKAFVVHHGIYHPASPANSPERARPYLLYVGHRNWYKNFNTLLDVYAAEKEIHSSVDLVCFGGDPFTEEEKKFLEQHQLTSRVSYISGDDALLNQYYAGALAFVYLSGYEGFGMPLLEAMVQGCPVMCSNTSSLPEVAGDAALLTDPNDKQAITKNLKAIVSSDSLRAELAKKGFERSALFSWDKCARETFEVYKKL